MTRPEGHRHEWHRERNRPRREPDPNVFETYTDMVLVGSDVYLVSSGSYIDGGIAVQGCGWVKKVPKSGGSQTIVWAGVGSPSAVVADTNAVY